MYAFAPFVAAASVLSVFFGPFITKTFTSQLLIHTVTILR